MHASRETCARRERERVTSMAVLVASSAAALPRAPAFGAALNCSAVVPFTWQYSPKRSPQRVHSFLSAALRDRDVVEAGSQVGDGISCWARTTRSTIGMEHDRKYCPRTAARLRALPAPINATLLCRSFYNYTPDADVYVWWQQPPGLSNEAAMKHLALRFANGLIRRHAQAYVLLDHEDVNVFERWASWSEEIFYDEVGHCLAHATHSARHLCGRAKGSFRVVAVPLSALPNPLQLEATPAKT